jgi:hypothetical protein
MITLFHGDCIEQMKNVSDTSVNLILCDLPYQITACSWDTIIPLIFILLIFFNPIIISFNIIHLSLEL